MKIRLSDQDLNLFNMLFAGSFAYLPTSNKKSNFQVKIIKAYHKQKSTNATSVQVEETLHNSKYPFNVPISSLYSSRNLKSKLIDLMYEHTPLEKKLKNPKNQIVIPSRFEGIMPHIIRQAIAEAQETLGSKATKAKVQSLTIKVLDMVLEKMKTRRKPFQN